MSSECPAVPADTSLEVWRMYVAGMRALSPAERVTAFEHFARLERAAESEFFSRRFADLEPGQWAVEVVRYRYGNELADELAPRLLARHAKPGTND